VNEPDPRHSRRVFLGSGLCLSGVLFNGCNTEASLAQPWSGPETPAADQQSCASSLLGAEYLGDTPFVGEGQVPFEQPLNDGLDGRLYTDLRKLTTRQLTVPNAAFYVRTRYPDQIDPDAPWRIRVHGLVQDELELRPEELQQVERPMGTHVLECSGNGRGGGFGLLSSAAWSGVPLLEVLDRVAVTAPSARILVSGFDEHSRPSANNHSTPGASWIFSFDQLARSGAFLATRMNGELLPEDHGKPTRLYIPGWYGCTCIKWVDRIELVVDDAPATSQMREFASRTHQDGTPELAKDFKPAAMHVAAMPIRVERWLLKGRISYRAVGIVWGGAAPVSDFEIRVGAGAWEPITACPKRSDTLGFSLWEHVWQPSTTGTQAIVLRALDPDVPTQRLDSGYYLREVEIPN
jgi:DMSO/TMAO reductase YedYZ molybdopterin-dependent catalytic subunit